MSNIKVYTAEQHGDKFISVQVGFTDNVKQFVRHMIPSPAGQHWDPEKMCLDVVANASRFGVFHYYVKDDRLVYHYNEKRFFDELGEL